MSNVTVSYDVYKVKSYEDALRIMATRDTDTLTHELSLHPSHHASSNVQKMPPECLVSRELMKKLEETILLFLTIIPTSLAEDSLAADWGKGGIYGNYDE